MAARDDTWLGSVIRDYVIRAEGFEGAELEANRKAALDYYYGRARGDEVEGKSAVQSLDVQDMTEAVLADMLQGCEETVVEFLPASAEDEEQAAAETELLNTLLMRGDAEYSGFVLLHECAQNALLLKNCIAQVWIEKDVQKTTEDYTALTDAEVAQLTQSTPNDRVTVEAIEPNEETPQLHDVRVKRERTKRAFKVRAVDPTNFLYLPDHDSVFLDTSRFLCERKLWTREELIEAGVPKSLAMKIPATAGAARKTDQAARRGTQGEDVSTMDPSQQQVMVFDCQVRADMSGDGRSERYRVLVNESWQVLKKWRIPFMNYAGGAVFMEAHQFTARSMYDRMREIQDQKTGFLRRWMDNADSANRPRMGVVMNDAEADDVANGEPVIRMRTANGIVPIPGLDIGPSCQQGLTYLDKVRAERGGAALDMQQAGAQVAGHTATGTEREYQAKEKLVGLMLRTMAETMLRSVFLLAHKTLRTHWAGEPLRMKIGGRWIEANPSTWPERTNVRLTLGRTEGQRRNEILALGQVIAKQEALLQAGKDGELVDESGYYRACKEWMRAQRIAHPEQYLVDPSSDEAQAAKQQKQQAAQAERMAQSQAMAAVVKMQRDFEEYKIAVEASLKYWTENLKAEIEEAKIIGGALGVMAGDLQGKQAKGEAAGAALAQDANASRASAHGAGVDASGGPIGGAAGARVQ